MYSFSYLEPVCCSMSSSNCCFLICIQVSQEAGQVLWYSHLFQNFPQVIVIYTVKGFGIVNKAETDVFLEVSCFFHDPADVGNLIYIHSSVPQSCTTLCDPMDCCTPGLPVLHQLPEFAQTHVHGAGDAIQPSHPLSSPFPAFNLSQHQGLF